MNKLSCQLCTGSLTEPKLCPHCSQIFCRKCITDYLAEKHFCPTCDNYIIDLVDCARLVDQFQQVLVAKKFSTIKNSKVGSSSRVRIETQIKKDICQIHNLSLEYYCNVCKVWICSDCGLIDSTHRSHSIVPKSQAQIPSRQQLLSQLSRINESHQKISTKKQRCLLDLQVYKTELKWSKDKIKKYFEDLIARVDQQGERQIKELIEKVKQYEDVLVQLTRKRGQIQGVLGNVEQEKEIGSKLQFNKKSRNSSKMKKSGKLQNKIDQHTNQKNFCKQKHQTCSKIPQTAHQIMSIDRSLNHITQASMYFSEVQQSQVVNLFYPKIKKIQVIQQIFPPFANFTYQFDYQNLKMDNFHYSNYFELWGQDWRVKIYPKGNSVVFGRYLSVFLELASGHNSDKSKKYVYRIQLISLNKAGSTIGKEYCSIFESGQSWGYSDYLKLENLNEYLHEGKLLFSISIRNQSYQGLCNDLKKYIVKIQNENKILQKLLCESSSQQNDSSLINSYYNNIKQGGRSGQSRSIVNVNDQSSININLNLMNFNNEAYEDASSDLDILNNIGS